MKKVMVVLDLIGSMMLFMTCSLDQPVAPTITDQTVYFRRYVALGNSITAGMQNSGMRQDWQKNSYPALIAKQSGVVDFELPLIAEPGIGSSRDANGNPMTPLIYKGGFTIVAEPLTVNPTSLLLNATLGMPYHNLGVPGATTRDLLYCTSYLNSQSVGNSFFNMILRNPNLGNTTPIQQALLHSPTMVTLWVGNNDILGGVLKGTIVSGTTVTPSSVYASLMDMIFDSLLNQTQAEIFVANIPLITTIPYVTTVPPIVINPATMTPILDASGKPISWLMEESNVKYVLLSALSLITNEKAGLPLALGGSGKALPGTVTLTETEAALVDGIINEYNLYLSGKDDTSDRINLVDTRLLMQDLTEGKISGASTRFILVDSTSVFSLDGVHPNNKGQQYIANEFIKVINAKLMTQISSL